MTMEENSRKKWIFDDKVVIVTGGAAGIGAGLVRALLSRNTRHVTFLDLAVREGTILERELLNNFGSLKVKFIKCDVSDEEQLYNAFEQVVNKYGRIDAVVNNAVLLSADKSSHKKMVDINFTAVINSTSKALDMMGVDKGGSGGVIINTSSLLALQPSAHYPVYSATKAAVLHFTNNIATKECYLKTRVRLVTVCLGPTDTAILHRDSLVGFDDERAQYLTSHGSERQKVESAVSGIIYAITEAENGSTWVIAGNKPPVDITSKVKNGLHILHEDNGRT